MKAPGGDLTRRKVLKYTGGGLAGLSLAGAVPWLVATNAAAEQKILAEQLPLDPLTIPKYANQLSIPRVLAPTVVRDSTGRVVRHDYDMSQNVIRAQVLPPGWSGRRPRPCRRPAWSRSTSRC